MREQRSEATGRAGMGLLAVAVVLAAVTVVLGASQVAASGQRSYIVWLQDSVRHPGKIGRAQLARYGGDLGFVYHYGPIGYSATLSDTSVEALLRDPLVEKVTVDGRAEATAQTKSTGIKRIYALGNSALQIDEKNNRWINADVAVIDAGFVKETDLNLVKSVRCKLVGGTGTCNEEETVDRADGHGTAVASILGAIDDNEGVVGVAPGVRLWSIKALENTGANESVVIAAINWVTAHSKEIEVANMSIGCATASCPAEGVQAAILEAVEVGIVFVNSAGNFNVDVAKNGYAANPYSIVASGIADYDGLPEYEAAALWSPSCGATQQGGDSLVGKDDERYSKSNWGELVDIAAPAVCIRALAPGGGVVWKTGTSFAAPEVAGAAAILTEHVKKPETAGGVFEIAETLQENGNYVWFDDSADGYWETLLDLSDEKVFY